MMGRNGMRRPLVGGFLLLSLGLFAVGGWHFWNRADDDPRLILDGPTSSFEELAPDRESEVVISMSNPSRRDCRIVGSDFC